MHKLLERDFVVNVSPKRAWQHLARVAAWPEWAGHISRVELDPPGEITPNSNGIIHLKNGIKSRFVMTAFNPPHNWKWAGPFLWLQVHYDHRFEPEGNDRTRLTWVVEAEGFGVSVLGRLFAFIYGRNVDRAIPRLIEAMNAH